MLVQSKNSDTEWRTLARIGDQLIAPGTVALKQNLAGFQPPQQVAESVGGNTDTLFREVGGNLEFFVDNRIG